MVRKLFWAYVVIGLLTLVFQLWVRTGACGGDCTLSYAKAVVWAVIWPASWIVYLV
jgi:hypothetical protein